jgi:hypothetical protein
MEVTTASISALSELLYFPNTTGGNHLLWCFGRVNVFIQLLLTSGLSFLEAPLPAHLICPLWHNSVVAFFQLRSGGTCAVLYLR